MLLFINLKSVRLGFSSSPPLGFPWGYNFFLCSVACLGPPSQEVRIGLLTHAALVAVFPGCHLSLQLSPNYSWLSTRLFLVVTGFSSLTVVMKHLLMLSWGTSSVMDLRSLGVSGLSNIRHPLSGGPAEVHDASACAPAAFIHGSALFIQSHLEAFSAASVLFRMALLLLSPVMPNAV